MKLLKHRILLSVEFISLVLVWSFQISAEAVFVLLIMFVAHLSYVITMVHEASTKKPLRNVRARY